MTYKIIGSDHREYGPVGPEELRRWIADGRVNAQSLVLAEGAPSWKSLGEFPEFADAIAGVSRAPAPFAVYPAGSGASAGTNGMAVTGFIFGLLSWTCCCAGPVVSVLGLTFSILGLMQTNRNPMQGGRGLAIAGIILSGLGLFITAGEMFFWFLSALSHH